MSRRQSAEATGGGRNHPLPVALRVACAERDINGVRLAQLTGISQATVHRLLSGVYTAPTLRQAAALRDALGLSLDRLAELVGHHEAA